MQTFWQDLFWKFCVERWEEKGVKPTVDNVLDLAMEASEHYLNEA